VQVVPDSAQLATLLSPLRMRVLEEMHEPQSATSLAPRLGLSRQKLNYHLRELEREGFLELVEERQRRGCVERGLQVTSRAFVVNPAMLGALADDPAQTRDRFSSAYLIAAATSLMRDVTLLRERAAAVEQKLAMFTMESEIRFASPASFREFTEDLASAVAALAASTTGRRCRELTLRELDDAFLAHSMATGGGSQFVYSVLSVFGKTPAEAEAIHAKWQSLLTTVLKVEAAPEGTAAT
jgi:DNA-binding transcriptional ArsR family regulator